MTHPAEARRRRWADVAVLCAAVYAISAVTWIPPEMFSGGDATEVARPDWLIAAYASGGVLGLLALLVAFHWRDLARAMVLIAGLLLIAGLFALHDLTPLALVSLGGSGLLFVIAAPFVGPMPTPEQEGKPR